MQESSNNLPVSRRKFLQASLGCAGSAALFSSGFPLLQAEEKIKTLEAQGWVKRPVACTMCGAFCGLLLLQKQGEPVSEKTIRIFPNPGHPQQGLCGRSASAMWVWNHPLRIKNPMKRIGEKGEGKFKEITWDEALDEIAEKLRALVRAYGERSIVSTSHSFSGFSKWLVFPLGSVNNIGHQSSCNSGGISAREWVFGKSFNGAGKIEPDYANLRYLILIGRSMGASMGALHTLNRARKNGARVVAVDPRMPDIAYGDAQWIGIKPGTDVAFLWSLIHVLLRDRLFDASFLTHHTNAPYLLLPDGKPLTQDLVKKNGDKELFAVFDQKKGELVFQGTKKDEKGNNIGFIQEDDACPQLDYEGTTVLTDGTEVKVESVYRTMIRIAQKNAPETNRTITGIPPETVEKIARDFSVFKGVIDDGWYTSKNGTDVELYQLIGVANALNGNIDRKGGLIVTAGAGFKVPSVSHGKGPNGEKWEVSNDKRIDKILYPESQGTIAVALDAALYGKPYPVKGMFVVGTTLFHREADSRRLANALKALDLLVVQDVMPHEVVDYADYVLPSTYFLERKDLAAVKWARDGSIYLSDPRLNPPKGVNARHDVWIALEIVRRAFPDRAARVGYQECRTAEEFELFFNGIAQKGLEKFLKAKEALKPGEARRIRNDLNTQGWSLINPKKYDEYPYHKPFATPSGKVEIYGFKSFSRAGYEAVSPLPEYKPSPAYSQPKANSSEFILVSGKNCTTCSGLNMFTFPTKFLGDRTVWMNPIDARRLKLSNGETIEIVGVDNPSKGRAVLTVTDKVVPGALFAFGFSGGVRTKRLISDPRYQFVKEGINSHWYATGYAQPITGNIANNATVRVNKIRG